MQLFRKKARSSSRVGLVVHAEQLAIAHMSEREGAPYLKQCERIAMDSSKATARALEKAVKDMGLEGLKASYVLNPRDYNLHLVEAPKVEPEELRAAVRWKIKDLLDMKVEDAAIDVFQVPDDAYRGRGMVYVVAALKSRIRSIIDMVNESGLELAVIDIPELAMKNISSLYLDDSNGLAFMDLRRTGSTMNISHNGNLYLTRRINTQLDQEVMRSDEWDNLKDRLVLEIQRSLDYYESQMGRGQITRIVLTQRQDDTEALTRALNEMLAAQVESLDLGDHLQSEIKLSPQIQQVAMAAIGATLRGSSHAESEPAPGAGESADDQEAA